MGYNEYKNHLKVCEYLGREPVEDYRKVHDFLVGLWEGMEIRHNVLPEEVYLHKGDVWYLSVADKVVWCHHDRVLRHFYGFMSNSMAEVFILDMIGDYLGIPGGLSGAQGVYG